MPPSLSTHLELPSLKLPSQTLAKLQAKFQPESQADFQDNFQVEYQAKLLAHFQVKLQAKFQAKLQGKSQPEFQATYLVASGKFQAELKAKFQGCQNKVEGAVPNMNGQTRKPVLLASPWTLKCQHGQQQDRHFQGHHLRQA